MGRTTAAGNGEWRVDPHRIVDGGLRANTIGGGGAKTLRYTVVEW
jgi:hypothetical protein